MTIPTLLFVVLLALTVTADSAAAAQNITGTVTNGTTGKPAGGVEVTLLALSQGMQELSTTKTDAAGRFSFNAPPDKGPHMVRATYQGVNYFPQAGPLMPGTTTAELTVYDSASKLDGVGLTVEVQRYQSDGGQLQGIALYAVHNQSQPARTLAGDKAFEIALPAGAEVESAEVKAPGGQPVATAAEAGAQKGHYVFSYPLRPGETQFQVSYHLPYKGEASISPKPLSDIQHFVVMTPQGMKFAPKDAKRFQTMPDQSGSTVMVATNVKPGENDLDFRISGTGVFQEESQAAQGGAAGGAMGGGQAAADDNRPGGGLGAPIDAPDPLHDYRGVILGVFALVLVLGGFYIIGRSNARPRPAAAGPALDVSSPTDRSTLLLEAIKEELFQLEVDRQQGKINPEEYAKAKSGLDETMKRALARATSN